MCGCNKAKTAPETFTVSLPDGSTKDVTGEVEARMVIAKNGGGSYKKK